MTTFADALRAQLTSIPVLDADQQKLLNVLDGKPGRKQTRRLKRMEAHVRAHLGIPGSEEVDWADQAKGGSIDWAAVIGDVLKILIALLPLLA